MPYVIRHPVRVDLFDNGEGEWGTASEAKQFATEAVAHAACEPGDVVQTLPEKQAIHQLSQVST